MAASQEVAVLYLNDAENPGTSPPTVMMMVRELMWMMNTMMIMVLVVG